MMRVVYRVALYSLLFLFIIFACGPRINKEALGPDEYFEYAKKKFDDGDYLDAVTEFTVIVLKFSGDPVVDDAQYYLAESHFKLKEYLIAVSEYEKLINDYPESPYVPLAQFKIGMAYDKLSLRPELDQEYTFKAIRAFQTFIEENPNHELKDQAQNFINKLREKLATKKLIAANTYRKMGVYDAAIVYYDIILQEYYDTKVSARAMYWKAECLYKLKKYQEAQVQFNLFIEKFPTHKFVRRAKERLQEVSQQLQNSETQITAQGDDKD